jgi:tetratricopeptide (TPR) repeat protein/O-antigen ligase
VREARSWRYLAQEAVLIPLFGYALLVGGTLNGLAMYDVIQVSLALLGAAGLTWFGWSLARREPYTPTPLLVALILLLVAYSVTTLTSMDPRRSLNALCLVGLYVLAYALISDLLHRGWPAELFVRALLIAGGILVVYGLVQLALWERNWLAVSGGSPLIPPVIVRLNPFLTHANMVAAFVNLLMPLTLVHLLGGRSMVGRAASAVYLICAGIVVLFTSSRSGWIGAGTGLGFTGLLWLATRGWLQGAPWRRLRWNAVTVGLALLALVLLAAAAVLFIRVASHPTHGSLFQSRRAYWGPAWRTFAGSPLVGSGPDTYASGYLRDSSVPPMGLFVRAHSSVLHMASEMGLVGLAAGAWTVAVALRAAVRRWRGAGSTAERLQVAGLVGSLAGCGMHSLFDTPQAVPSISLTLILLLALLEGPAGSGAAGRARGRWWRAGLALLWLGLLGGGVWMQSAYRPFLEGAALANSGDYEAAATLLDEAAERDAGHALYYLQAGYAYGRLAATADGAQHAAALETAVRYLEQGIAHEPAYALNHANLAALYWSHGETGTAVNTMAQAMELAPREATFSLNLGRYYEELGREDEAMAVYSTTLALRPAWVDSYFWRSTPLRQKARTEWGAPRPVVEEPSPDELEQAVKARPDRATAHVDWAAELVAQGRYQEAGREVEIALFIGDLEPAAKVRARFLLAELAHLEGDLGTAIARAEGALQDVRYQSIFGPGTYGTSLYGWGVFYRMGLAADMLPQLETIRYTDEVVAFMIRLGEWHEQDGEVAAAREIYEEVLAAAPDASAARRRLAGLPSE